ncbi:HNH endonuclease [Clostridium bornimense]|uniref:HNH endonuclease n=1 Tax=Clostridium bornimense TaxID=1216932 RepID=UPI001C11C5DF|nr:HNH endonuclease [Clostridium bornimense]MBU5315085.1 HNH endonuclease [Clostridium bornimense]
MSKCEICGANADKHHIIFRSEGGLNFPLNFKFLCNKHHRGKYGPHNDKLIDLKYKLELQNNLYLLLTKQYYSIDEISKLININPRLLKKLLVSFKNYKEGYKKEDIIYILMGKKFYSEEDSYYFFQSSLGL